MNVVEVLGGTQSQRKYAESMVQFCIDTLMPRMTTLDIEVKLTVPQGAMGYCLETDNNRTFEIELDRKLSLRKLMETLAHEMVHVKQYARREMNDWQYKEVYYKWKGTYVPDSTNYWDLPWEIEANGREVGLFIRWCEQAGYGDKAWANI